MKSAHNGIPTLLCLSFGTQWVMCVCACACHNEIIPTFNLKPKWMYPMVAMEISTKWHNRRIVSLAKDAISFAGIDFLVFFITSVSVSALKLKAHRNTFSLIPQCSSGRLFQFCANCVDVARIPQCGRDTREWQIICGRIRRFMMNTHCEYGKNRLYCVAIYSFVWMEIDPHEHRRTGARQSEASAMHVKGRGCTGAKSSKCWRHDTAAAVMRLPEC